VCGVFAQCIFFRARGENIDAQLQAPNLTWTSKHSAIAVPFVFMAKSSESARFLKRGVVVKPPFL
jgi:hypothetical protein